MRVPLSSSTAATRLRPRKSPTTSLLWAGVAFAVFGDLTNDDEVRRLIDDAQAFVKPVEIVVNNAGGSGDPEDWTTTRTETWASGYDRNVLAAVRVTTRLLPSMRAAERDRIVNISSLVALMPRARRPAVPTVPPRRR